MVMIAFFHPRFGIPAIVFYFPEKFVVFHHSRAARLVMVEPDKTAVTEFILETRNMFGQNMGVDVDGKQEDLILVSPKDNKPRASCYFA
jgi:hypothetical protein